MLGVFTSYELQVIHDWIRGESSADGQAFAQDESTDGQSPARGPSFRVAARLAAARGQAETTSAKLRIRRRLSLASRQISFNQPRLVNRSMH